MPRPSSDSGSTWPRIRRDRARAALFRAGETAYLAGQYERAGGDFARFRRDYPEDRLNAYVLPYLGQIALDEGKAAEAEGLLREALRRFPQGKLRDSARLGLARAREKQADGAEAEKLYRQVVEEGTGIARAEAWFRLGALQYAGGQFAAAAESFAAVEKVEKSDGGSSHAASARLGRGWRS